MNDAGSVGTAEAGQAFQLDYDNPDNPFFIRAIKDELCQVASDLFLGQAYVLWLGKPRLVLCFGLALLRRTRLR